jgi:hypothetical protein
MTPRKCHCGAPVMRGTHWNDEGTAVEPYKTCFEHYDRRPRIRERSNPVQPAETTNLFDKYRPTSSKATRQAVQAAGRHDRKENKEKKSKSDDPGREDRRTRSRTRSAKTATIPSASRRARSRRSSSSGLTAEGTKPEYAKLAPKAPAWLAHLSGRVGLVLSRGRKSSYVRFGRDYVQIPNVALVAARPGDARRRPTRRKPKRNEMDVSKAALEGARPTDAPVAATPADARRKTTRRKTERKKKDVSKVSKGKEGKHKNRRKSRSVRASPTAFETNRRRH